MTTNIIEAGVLQIDLHHKVVIKEGKTYELSRRPFDILTYIAEADGRPVPSSELSRNCFPHPVLSNTVEANIHLLRRALGQEVIKTRRQYGYYIQGA